MAGYLKKDEIFQLGTDLQLFQLHARMSRDEFAKRLHLTAAKLDHLQRGQSKRITIDFAEEIRARARFLYEEKGLADGG